MEKRVPLVEIVSFVGELKKIAETVRLANRKLSEAAKQLCVKEKRRNDLATFVSFPNLR